MAVFQAYFDESYGPHGLVCVAGYIFTKSKAQVFDRAWRAMLRRYCLPYFRMSSCAHGSDPFAGLTKEQRVAALREAISIIHASAVHGVAATVDPKALASMATDHLAGRFKTTPYELCVFNAVVMVAAWARDHRPGENRISYIFEAGDSHEAQANAMLTVGFQRPQMREYCMYRGHAFFPKVEATPCQAADLLAWQWFTDAKRRSKPSYMQRRDLSALLGGRVTHKAVHADAAFLSALIYDMKRVREGLPMLGLGPSSGRLS